MKLCTTKYPEFVWADMLLLYSGIIECADHSKCVHWITTIYIVYLGQINRLQVKFIFIYEYNKYTNLYDVFNCTTKT